MHYDALLKAAVQRGWALNTDAPEYVKLVVCREPLELAVAERTEPIAAVVVRPGERRPRRPGGALAVSFSTGYDKTMISDKPGARIESKFDALFVKAEALASEIHARNEWFAEMRRQEAMQQKRRQELQSRIERLDRNMAACRRAARIRAYAQGDG